MYPPSQIDGSHFVNSLEPEGVMPIIQVSPRTAIEYIAALRLIANGLFGYEGTMEELLEQAFTPSV